MHEATQLFEPAAGHRVEVAVEQVARLHPELPLLAEALGRALPHTVARGELFHSQPGGELHKPQGKHLFYVRAVWTPITRPNAATSALERALAKLEPVVTPTRCAGCQSGPGKRSRARYARRPTQLALLPPPGRNPAPHRADLPPAGIERASPPMTQHTEPSTPATPPARGGRCSRRGWPGRTEGTTSHGTT
ncbi:hypothetical protein GCM10007977_025550 [Dactylosporangium sucinum]|uniref:Uncharacterized protein n=1 Tax=Dactylosporangium sucinum TaxID=1424081 RepID=A0A917TH55_9ACTN|nr:hypothetical protein GCM10007977_025550 [Dactylosporangium sucinum]